MKLRKLTAPIAAAIAAATLTVPTAGALPARDLGPANPTTIGAQCTNPGDRGQTIDIKRTYFDGSAGTWTVSNYNDEDLPITRSIKETKTKTWNVSAGVDFSLLDLIHFTFSSSYTCLLYTSDAADDLLCVDLGGRRIIKKKKNK